MPWRTVLEVTRQMRTLGHDARLISLNAGIDHPSVNRYLDMPVYSCPKDGNMQISIDFDNAETFQPELVYWPVRWCSSLKIDFSWHPWNCSTIVYHGDCCYRAIHVRAAIRYMPIRSCLSLFVECFIPKWLLVYKMKKRDVRGVLCMTELTKREFLRAGWSNEQAIAIPPGLPDIEATTPSKDKNNIFSDQPYVLFLGNPLPIRGIDVLLSASRRVFANADNARIICLLRPDPGEEMRIAREKILLKVKKLGIEEQFICITKKLTPEEVRQSIRNAQAVVMPFLFIPSEIPLGILEAMRLGTPVITTQSGGTSDYVDDGGWIVPPGNVPALAKAITSALNDDELLQKKKTLCLEKMKDHPTWEKVGDEWFEFGLSMLNGTTT